MDPETHTGFSEAQEQAGREQPASPRRIFDQERSFLVQREGANIFDQDGPELAPEQKVSNKAKELALKDLSSGRNIFVPEDTAPGLTVVSAERSALVGISERMSSVLNDLRSLDISGFTEAVRASFTKFLELLTRLRNKLASTKSTVTPEEREEIKTLAAATIQEATMLPSVIKERSRALALEALKLTTL